MNQILNYLSYLLKSKNLHGIHSPFVYVLVKEVIYNCKQINTNFKAIETIRKKLRKDTTLLSGADYGAGSLTKKTYKTIGQFASSSSKSVKYSRLLYRLAKWHQPQYALEMGTALGISGMYQASGFGNTCKFITLEGNSVLAQKASENFKELNLSNVEILEGNFDTTLEIALEKFPHLDWVFFDGNHKKEPTLRYFHQCLEKASENALFIFDDINWSAQMQEAWLEIKENLNVYVTVDLFFIGLVFLKKRPQKENFVVRF
ncbi:MAG: O-methyltransferase [Bacteroidia bacterium]